MNGAAGSGLSPEQMEGTHGRGNAARQEMVRQVALMQAAARSRMN